MKKIDPILRKRLGKIFIGILIVLGIVFSNLYLQWCQNNLSVELAMKFAFSWHTEKFLLGSLVLLIFYLFWVSLSGSLLVGGGFLQRLCRSDWLCDVFENALPSGTDLSG